MLHCEGCKRFWKRNTLIIMLYWKWEFPHERFLKRSRRRLKFRFILAEWCYGWGSCNWAKIVTSYYSMHKTNRKNLIKVLRDHAHHKIRKCQLLYNSSTNCQLGIVLWNNAQLHWYWTKHLPPTITSYISDHRGKRKKTHETFVLTLTYRQRMCNTDIEKKSRIENTLHIIEVMLQNTCTVRCSLTQSRDLALPSWRLAHVSFLKLQQQQ